jgi:hypothetical protein
MNDEGGIFYSSIYNPIIGGVNWQQQSKQKHINWGSIYLGLNIYLGTEKSKKPGDNKK